MDFENQFTRPMIHALGTRMAILKMESVCDKPDAKFQQGFELGFEEAFNFIREFGRADELIKRLDAREKIKKAADLAKKTGIAQVTVYDLGVYLAEHLERTNTFQPSDNEIMKSSVMKYVCEKVRELPGNPALELTDETLSACAIQRYATVSEIANIINDAQIEFRRDPSAKIDNSDLGKLYEGTVFDLAKYIVEHVNVKV